MSKYSPSELVTFLKAQTVNAKFIDKLKIAYRPYICPFHLLLGEVNSESRVFDIGCGSGQFALLLAEFVKPRQIGGIEIEPELIKNAEALLEKYSQKTGCRFSTYNGYDIPKYIKEYDAIFLIDVLHHVPRKQQISFLRSIFNSISMGAKLVLKDINKAHIFSPINKLHDLVLSGEIGNELSLRETKKYVEEIGFKIIKAETKNMLLYPHFTLVLEKV